MSSAVTGPRLGQRLEGHGKKTQPVLFFLLKYAQATQHKTVFSSCTVWHTSGLHLNRRLIRLGRGGLAVQHDSSMCYRKQDCINTLWWCYECWGAVWSWVPQTITLGA